MSVLKRYRSLSNMEFFHNAIVLRKEFTTLLLRDFGVKDKIRNISLLSNKLSDNDKIIIDNIIKKYGNILILEDYPEWIISRFRNNILNILDELLMNITKANSIYPVYEQEFYERRILQDRAIGNCECLFQEMQHIISVLPTDSNKYMRYVELINKEISLLKGWRKSDNRILKRLQKSIN